MRYSKRDLSYARLYSVYDVISDSESSKEDVIYSRQEMKSVTADLAIKDIMGRDNDNKVYEMRSEDFSTAWPDLFWNTFTTVGEFSVFCKVFSQIVFRNVIVPLPKSQTRHPARA